jgi:hypothetical protein
MLQLKPNRWSCAITSLAMALRIPVAQLIEEIGHDGSEIVFDLREPLCRRGFHSQELIFIALSHGFAVTPIEVCPMIKPSSGTNPMVEVWSDAKLAWENFTTCIHETFGILEGRTTNGTPHAVHYRYGDIWCPEGVQYKYNREACEQYGFYGNRALVFTRHV